MNVSFSRTPKTSIPGVRFAIADRTLIVTDAGAAVRVQHGTVTLFLEGEFYYTVDGAHLQRVTRDQVAERVAAIMGAGGVRSVPARLEGSYVGCWIDTASGSAGLFADALNRTPVYYTESDSGLEASTALPYVLARRVGKKSYSAHGLYSYLLLGYTPITDTLYDGVRRLGADETLVCADGGVAHEVRPSETAIREYDRADIDRYDDLIVNAVLARSAKRNVVMVSGGWDSTSLISLLTRGHEASAITSIVFDVILADGQSFNIYEVDKANRIGDFFGIKTERAVIDYRDKSLIDLWEKSTANLRDRHVYFWLNHVQMANQIGATAAVGTSVFNGEASDSVHNFGFSQFVSVNYDNMALREYADKAKSYLYGPTFFRSLADGSFASDKVLQFFHGYYGKEQFASAEGMDRAARLESYLQAFVLSYPRVPFAKWQNGAVAGEKLASGFADDLNRRFFSGAAAALRPETLYYHLLQMYRHFHFQSAQIAVSHAALAPFGLSCQMPFMDAQLLQYLYAMPESWGRGLELRTTKFPLRYLATERWRMPLDILQEAGPHSYIAEADKKWTYAGGDWTIQCEILYNSVFTPYFKDLFRSKKVESLFDPALFEVPAMQRIIDAYAGGTVRAADAGLLFKAAMLFSVGLH